METLSKTSETSPEKETNSIAHNTPKKRKLDQSEVSAPVRIYADGVFDLFHIGHMRVLEQCKNMFPRVHLIVGVCKDEDTLREKGRTVLSSEERVESVRHCRWVDEVVADAPWILDKDFMEKHRIDYVAHDPAPYATDDCDDSYGYVKSIGKFLPTQRTEGISTSCIINRVVRDYDSFVRRNLKKGYSRQDMNLGFLKEKSIKVTDKMDRVKSKVDEMRHKVRDKSDEVLDSSKHILEKWIENSNKYIDEFLQMFGKDGKLNSFVRNTMNKTKRKDGEANSEHKDGKPQN